MPTRDEITTALASQRERIEAWFHALSDAQMTQPATASEVEGGQMWTPKDHLAHVLGVERYFHGVIKRAADGAEDATGFYTQTGTDDRAAWRNLANQSNERLAEKYRDTPAEALFARLGETRQATLALLGALDDEQLAQSVPHSHFGDGTIGGLFMTIAQHGGQHLAWLNDALGNAGATHDTESK